MVQSISIMEELLDKIKAKNIGIKLVDNNLKLHLPKGFNDDAVIAEIRKRKSELIDYISERYDLSEDKLEIEPVSEKPYYKTSSAQKRMFFLYEFDKDSCAYNIPYKLKLTGKIDQVQLNHAFRKLIARHDILRTSFELLEDEIVQRVHQQVSADIEFISVREGEVDQVAKSFIRPFDLMAAPLIRMAIVSSSSKDHVLIVDMHHIVSDGLSEDLLIQDFMNLYLGKDLPALKLQYKDFAEWQHANKQQSSLKRQRKFWLDQFSDRPDALTLAADFNRPKIKNTQGGNLTFDIDPKLVQDFKVLLEREGATLFVGFLSIFNILLSKLSHQEDIVVGSPVAGREHSDFESIIGLFVNTIAMRNQPTGDLSYRGFLHQVMSNTLASLDHQYYQFEDLVDDLDLERETSRHPLFDVLFVFQSLDDHQLLIPGLELGAYEDDRDIAKFDLTLGIVESGQKVTFTLNYAAALFTPQTIKRYAGYFDQLLRAVVANPATKLQEIDMLSVTERDQVLVDFNDTQKDFPGDQSFLDLFHAQVGQRPDQVALVANGHQATYRELDQWSNALAHQLVNTPNPGGYVALHFEPSIELIVSILAVIRSGQVFIPVDIYFPEDRKTFIFEDSGSQVLLTDGSFDIDTFEGQVLTVNKADLTGEFDAVARVHEARLLYTIFTSGSTGRAKGVNITHRNLINYCDWTASMVQTPEAQQYLLTSNYAADAGYQQIFTSLLYGGQLHLLSREVYLQPAALGQYIRQNGISVMKMTPSLLNVFITDETFNEEVLKSVKYLVIGGEAINAKDLTLVHQLYPGLNLMNHYGPTETTIGSVARFVESDQLAAFVERPTIGQPIQNTSCLILDRYGKLQPVGVPGELCIGGEGVGQGYLNNEALTNEKFMANPYAPGERMYRTGDLARWLADGHIEFLGRIDHQVKIRGNRIELGEIEHELLQQAAISEAVVIARDHEGAGHLVGYYVADEEQELATLRGALSESLPDYMIPSSFVYMDRLPLTSNGKLDRKALPHPEFTQEEQYVAPRTAEEKLLCDIWSEVLGVDKIGIRDNFFSIGGDSIKSIQISSRVRKAGYQLTIQDLFNSQYIAELALKMKRTDVVADQGIITGQSALTPVQDWFLQGPVASKAHYNLSMLFQHEDGITAREVTKIFSQLLLHHDALRMVFKLEEQGFVQQNLGEEVRLHLEEFDLTTHEDTAEALLTHSSQLQASLDLENGPLLKLGLFHLKEGSRLLIVVHHLIIDGVSWRILIEDINYLQSQVKEQATTLSLPPKTDSFLSWSTHLDQYRSTKTYKQAKAYWASHAPLKGGSIPRDFADGVNRLSTESQVTFKLDKSLTKKLLTTAHQAFGTQINDLLLTGLMRSMHQTYGLDSLSLDMEGHGREAVGEGVDISRTLGWFTTIFPVLLPHASSDWSRQVREVKETLRQLPNKGFDFLLYLQEKSIPQEERVQSQVFFEYFGQFDEDQADQGFSIAGEEIGANVDDREVRAYDWRISSVVAGEELQVNIAYSTTQYKAATVQAFADAYQTSLDELVNYCVSQREVVLSPSDVGYSALSVTELDALQQEFALSDIYPLSPMQEGLLYHTLTNPTSDQYFEQMTYRLSGEVDMAHVETSMNLLMDRHEVLRTLFLADRFERAVQVVLKDRSVDFDFKDVSAEVAGSTEADVIARYKEHDKARKFDLGQDTLMRLTVLKTADQHYVFIWSHHHILMDGWCMSIIVNEYNYLYSSLMKGQDIDLPAVQPYANYIKWLENRDDEASKNYWTDYLSGYESIAGFPRKEDASQHLGAFDLQQTSLIIGEDRFSKLRDLGARHRVTLNNIIQAAWGILLGRYSHANDVVFGAVVSGRPAEIDGIEDMVGLFINTIPVRMRVHSQDIFADTLQRMQQQALEGEAHHYSPLNEVKQYSELGTGLLDHILVFENYPISEEIEGTATGSTQIEEVTSFEQSNYDLVVVISPGQQLLFDFYYNGHAFASETISNLADHFNNLIDQLLVSVDTRVAELDLVGETETRLLAQFNDTSTPYPADQSVVTLFQQQVQATPDHVALEQNHEQLTYQQLNEKTDQLASIIGQHDIAAGDRIALFMDRSADAVAGILAILKVGAVYVPIDIDYPQERINYILEDSSAKLIISHSSLNLSLDRDYPIIRIDRFENTDEPFSATAVKPIDPAYIMYTSGTTGVPKGSIISQRSIVRLVRDTNYVQLSEATRILLTGSLAFDATTFEIWGALLNGGTVCLADKNTLLDTVLLGQAIAKHQVNTMWLTSPLFNQHVDADHRIFAGMTQLLVGGDKLSPYHINKVRHAFPEISIINGYGPTENTTFSVCYAIDKDHEDQIPIGKPISNSTAYILTPEMKLQPVGAVGELYLGGHGLSLGYLNNDELTHEKFIAHPFLADEKLYQTGDLARWLPDGNIEFLGRQDSQVKIRGYRIEVGEVEQKILQFDGVKEAVVTVGTHEGNKFLIGYYAAPQAMELSGIRNQLSESLPDYMIPAYFIHLDELPLNANGKVDYRALPAPEYTSLESYVAPTTQEERILCGVWAEVLGVEKIGIRDNFFSVGGDSIKSIQISARVRKAGYSIAVQDLLAYPYIEQLANRMKLEVLMADQGEIVGSAALTPIQQWYFNGPVENKNHFNFSVLLNFPEGISLEEVNQIFTKLMAHHDALRMVIRQDGETLTQENLASGVAPWSEESDLRSATDADAELLKLTTKLQASLDVFQGPLFKLGLYRRADGSRLMIAIHHLVMDGLSWRILFEDINSLYHQIQSGKADLELPPKTDSFLSWSGHLQDYLKSNTYQQAKDYWKTFASKKGQMIPRDFEKGENLIAHEQQVSFALDKDYTRKFLTDAHKPFNTQANDLLLTALMLGVHRSYELTNLKLDMEGHGREDIGKGLDLSRTVGWFTTISSILLEAHPDDLTGQIKRIKETLRNRPNKGFDHLLYQYADQGNSPTEKPQVFFEYLGQFDSDVADTVFSVSGDAIGANVSSTEAVAYDWRVSCLVSAEQLQVSIAYSKEQYKAERIQELANRYEASLKELIEYCTADRAVELSPADVTFQSINIEQLDELQQQYALEDVYPLSPMQEGMLFHTLAEDDSDQYFEQMVYGINGTLDMRIVEESMNLLMERHQVLRSLFIADRFDRSVQLVIKDRQVDFAYVDLRNELKNASTEELLETYKEKDKARKFVLGKDVLMRLTVLQVADQEYIFIWSHHHILMDGWCISIVINDYRRIYSSLIKSEPLNLPPVRKYSEYINWIESGDKATADAYWKDYLSGYESLAQLPFKKLSAETHNVGLQHTSLIINEELVNKLKSICSEKNVTMNNAIQAIWSLLLCQYNNTDDVVFGTVVSGRPAELDGVEEMIGLFINTVPIRVKMEEDLKFIDLLTQMQNNALKSEPYHYSPLYEVQKFSELEEGELFDHLLIFENYPWSDDLEGHGKGSNSISEFSVFGRTNYDLCVTINPDREIEILFKYNGEVFEEKSINRIMEHFDHLLRQVVNAPETAIAEVDILPQTERAQVLDGFNQTSKAYEKGASFIDVFRQRVQELPDHVALVKADQQLTFAELDRRSDQLALTLQERAKLPEYIALHFETSIEMMVSILAVIKTGSAFIPLDIDYPNERKEAILQDCGTNLLLTNLSTTSELKYEGEIIHIDLQPDVAHQPVVWKHTSEQALYAIFTSGSTGKPKGVRIAHGNVVNYATWMSDALEARPGDRYLYTSNYASDSGYQQIFTSLLSGGALYLLQKTDYVEPALVVDYINEQEIKIVKMTPGLLNVFVNSDPFAQIDLKTVTHFLCGGEKINVKDVQCIHERYPEVLVMNHYGPTETTVGAVATLLSKNDTEAFVKRPTIGNPIHNTACTILDKHDRLQPIGVAGELCISGDGVGLGYLNDQGMTRQKFMLNPYLNNLRMYRTGDMARWLPNGQLEFLGRVDQQVKIRGFRIELKEIELQLLDQEGISEVVVTTREETDIQLVAYYVASSEIDSGSLRDKLAKTLPDYMIPAYFVCLEKLPLTSNNKIDFKALPDPELASEDNYVAPKTKEEEILAEVWSQVLGVEKVGTRDDFFAIGGDSIKSIQISARARKRGYKLTIQDLFRNNTIEELALVMRPEKAKADLGLVTGKGPVSPIQQRFFDGHIVNKNRFNFSLMLAFKEGITADIVTTLFNKLRSHHDALRIVFRSYGDQIVQENLGVDKPLSLEEIDLGTEPGYENRLLEATTKLQDSLDLFTGPLFKLGLYHSGDSSYLAMVVHHLVIDGVSWRVLFEDIDHLYQQIKSGTRKLKLPSKTTPFLQWPAKLSEYKKSDNYAKASAYWQAFAGQQGDRIPRDYQESSNAIAEEARVSFTLDKAQTKLLLTEANVPFHTQINDLLLTGLIMGANKVFGLQDLKLEMEGHGREDIGLDVDISRTVGWFTSIFPVMLQAKDGDMALQVKTVKEAMRKMPNKGFDYLLHHFDQPVEERRSLDTQLFFEYMGQVDSDVSDKTFGITSTGLAPNISDSEMRNYEWRITGITSNDQLEIGITYSKAQYKEETLQSFVDAYQQSLLGLIEFLTSYGKVELTPSDVSFPAITIDELQALQHDYAIQNVYPLSPMQEGMLFHALSDADSAQYFEQITYNIQGELDVAAVRRSMDMLVERHDVLRTIFMPDRFERPVQVVLKSAKADFSYIDLRGLEASADLEQIIEGYKAKDKAQTFDLTKDAMMRLKILQIEEESFVFIWSRHHILMDGWCMKIIVNEYSHIYSGIVNQHELNLPKPIPYVTYIEWLESKSKEESEQYWKAYLSEYENVASLPKHYPAEGALTDQYVQLKSELTIGQESSKQLADLSVKYGLTMSTLLQTLWGILLGKYNNTRDVIFGNVVSGRPAEINGVENIVGLFINTVPVRIQWDKEESFGALLKKAQDNALKSELHHSSPLYEVQQHNDLGGNLLDHILVFENYPIGEEIENKSEEKAAKGNTISGVSTFEQTNYNLTLDIFTGAEVTVSATYDGQVYRRETIEQVLTHLHELISQVLVDPEIAVGQLSLVTQAEKNQLLHTLNSNVADFPAEETFLNLFYQSVNQCPDQVAITDGHHTLNYEELDQLSNRIAHFIIAEGMKDSTIIPVALNRGVRLVATMLGIHKAGFAFLALDIHQPKERVGSIVADCQAQLVITEAEFADLVTLDQSDQQVRVEVIPQEVSPMALYAEHPVTRVNEPINDVAYVIYTSGSTGKPKGVLLHQQGMINHFRGLMDLMDLDERDCMAQTAECSFDVFIMQALLCLVFGGKTVVIPKEEVLNGERLSALIKEHDITMLELVPSVIKYLLNDEGFDITSSQLKWLISNGETLTANLARDWYEVYPSTSIINAYGPAEASDDVTAYIMPREEEAGVDSMISIGRPLKNIHISILDNDLQLCPVGVKGEICISGVAVGIGYWNNEEETNKKFVPNPYKAELGEDTHPVIYRTGDTGYWKEDGNLMFLGRLDSMVKVRGARLEPGEVESALLHIDGIKEAVVVVREAELCAYYVSESGDKIEDLRAKMSSKLPDYMMPSFFIRIGEMPLTANGKVDRKALPTIEIDELKQYVAPESEMEVQLASIWSDILEIDQEAIGVTQGFFELGAHSINTFHLVNRIHKLFGAEIALKDVFVYDNIRDMARFITTQEAGASAGVVRVEDRPFYPVSSAQERLFYYNLIHPGSTSKNVSVPVKINVTPDEEKITTVLQMLIDRHESLRTSFVFEDDRLTQKINEGVRFELQIKETGDTDLAEIYNELKQPFDLSAESLLRCSLIRSTTHGNLLFFEVHHIICDGLSFNVLIQEFKDLYYGKQLDRPQLRYVDYCVWVKDEAVINRHKTYWSDRLSGQLPMLKPTGKAWVDFDHHPEQTKLVSLESQLLDQVKETNKAHQLTDYMLFLSAYYIVIQKMFASKDVIIGTETVGRSQHGLDDIVGTFINVLPLRMNIEDDMTRDDLFRGVKDTVIEAFEYQDFQFDEILLMLSEDGRLPENPLIQFHLTFSNSINAIDFQEFELFNIEMEGVKDAEYELIIDITRSEESLALNFKYSECIYDQDEIALLMSNYLYVLKKICGDQNFKIGDIVVDRYEEPIY